jgi:beta-mannosidase
MKITHNLSQLHWQLAGFVPEQWRFSNLGDIAASAFSDVPALPARVPGSVQEALRVAGVIPDWNNGLDARQCEWVESRQWVFQAKLPAKWVKNARQLHLRCDGLDYAGWVYVNGHEAGAFRGAFTPHVFNLTPHLRRRGNLLQIIFDVPPRWLGQFGRTSQMTDWKPRFNYTWDWTARLVQIGIWDAITLEASDDPVFESLRCVTEVDAATGLGSVRVIAAVSDDARCSVEVTIEDAAGRDLTPRPAVPLLSGGLRPPSRPEELPVHAPDAGHRPAGSEKLDILLTNLPIELWQPNGLGHQPLYTVRCRLIGPEGRVYDAQTRQVGFRRIEWRPCEGAPAAADPWICVVNGQPLFLQGVNWTPIRPNFADVTEAEYRKRLELYRDLGCNLLRVWGGAFLEKACFYRICDELGLLVWQEFPLSSSGVDNWPPEDARSIAEMAEIAASYIARRQHHACLLLWCGGNELQGDLKGNKMGSGKPVDATHPLIARFSQIVAEMDPGRRFLPTSSSGPRFGARAEDFGKGLHWDVHGPWKMPGTLAEWQSYWDGDDALFRSETGAPGASPVEIIERYRGDFATLPGSADNPLWRRTSWWIEWPTFVAEQGREPASLEEFVAWSQARQAEALRIAAAACKGRFPRCGGFLVWMGHDSFPCTANTAIVDFDGRAKPAAVALGKVFHSQTT